MTEKGAIAGEFLSVPKRGSVGSTLGVTAVVNAGGPDDRDRN
jgi:hypothetical protein